MKKLQNNFTTPEQSKRLLELGVPAWTADCFYPLKTSDMPIIISDIKVGFNLKYSTPCWSVGRLIEILTICYTKLPFETEISNEYGGVDSLVVAYNNLISDMDFSKLEE